MLKKTLILISLFSLSIPAHSAILVDENGNSVSETTYEINSEGHGFRRRHKVGVGLSAAGIQGLLGVNLELNFSPEFGLASGFGMGPGYQTFHVQLKKVLAGNSVMPYIAGGISRWYSAAGHGDMEKSTPDFLARRFLSKQQQKTGDFSEWMLFPSVGVQYLTLSGDWAGFSLFAEVLLLINVDDLIVAPTGGVGAMYYF